MTETIKDEIILPNGNVLWWEDNKAGGRTYYSSEIGGGVMVWDTCLVTQSTLLTAMATEHSLQLTVNCKSHK